VNTQIGLLFASSVSFFTYHFPCSISPAKVSILRFADRRPIYFSRVLRSLITSTKGREA